MSGRDAGSDELLVLTDALPRRLVLARVPAAVARARSRLAVLIDPLPLAAAGAQAFLALDAPRPEASNAPWLSASVNGARAALQLPWGQARVAAGLPVEDADAADAALLVEEGLAPWIGEAEALLGLSLRLDGLTRDRPDLPVPATLNVQGRGPDRAVIQGSFPMRLSLAAADALAVALTPRRAPRRDPKGLALRLVAEVASLDVDLATLRSLRPGDAVTLEQAHRRVVLEDALAAPAAPEGPGRHRLLGPFAPMAARPATQAGDPHAMVDPDVPALPEALLDEVEVRLSFRAGEALMDLATLRGLAAGAVIETTEGAGTQVDVLVNGRVVGTGEIIDVAGRRAVQIRTLFTAR